MSTSSTITISIEYCTSQLVTAKKKREALDEADRLITAQLSEAEEDVRFWDRLIAKISSHYGQNQS